MKKVIIGLTCVLNSINISNACSDIFINKNGYTVEARSMDFPVDIASINGWGYIGVENITNIAIDTEKVPKENLTHWENKYGYFGRFAFGSRVVDGINTQGLSFSALYLEGTEYPKYNPNDNRDVLGIYDLSNFLLGMAKDVNEAIDLIKSHQIIDSAIPIKNGIFINNIPIHFSLRDKTGNTAIVEFIDGNVKIHNNAGNVLTNLPVYNEQLENANNYNFLLKNNKRDSSIQNIDSSDKITSHSANEDENLLGLPGDFSSTSRFVRGYILTSKIKSPTSINEAKYQAVSILNNLSVPPYKSKSSTLWTTVKDLQNLTVAYKDNILSQGESIDRKYVISFDSGYITYDLKAMNFSKPKGANEKYSIKSLSKNDIIKVISMENVIS
ncbi:linear amide C-N hydrolase [Francisella philomiragia]|uniref:linear amide C-N hydrolase n=1 Tax=Francisella philomiragia TaxID=28110 RepID=UPI003517BBE8